MSRVKEKMQCCSSRINSLQCWLLQAKKQRKWRRLVLSGPHLSEELWGLYYQFLGILPNAESFLGLRWTWDASGAGGVLGRDYRCVSVIALGWNPGLPVYQLDALPTELHHQLRWSVKASMHLRVPIVVPHACLVLSTLFYLMGKVCQHLSFRVSE